jgi:hypothetical protein
MQHGHAFILSFAGRLGIGRMRTDVVPQHSIGELVSLFIWVAVMIMDSSARAIRKPTFW